MSKCFQIHKDKFKSIITVSEWQKNNIIIQLNIPSERIVVSRNAIDITRFKNTSKKVPFRFIYSSDPSRGLTYLIQMIPKIKRVFPETTLHIFVLKELIDSETLSIINKLHDYVFLHTRISQDKLAREFQLSDIWLYPTDFKETIVFQQLKL